MCVWCCSYSLASGVRIPDLADGRVHVAKIRYEPFLDESQVRPIHFTQLSSLNYHYHLQPRGTGRQGTRGLTDWSDSHCMRIRAAC